MEILELHVDSGPYFEANATAINHYNLTSFTSGTMILQVEFANPQFISRYASDPDYLEISFV